MMSSAKTLNQLNGSASNPVDNIDEKLTNYGMQRGIEGVNRFVEEGFQSHFPRELPQQQWDTFSAGVKQILEEEKVPNDKHNEFIDIYVDFIKFYLSRVDQLTTDNLEQFAKDRMEYENAIGLRLNAIGYPATDPNYLRIALRVVELPLEKELNAMLGAKVLEISLNKLNLAEDFKSAFFDTDSSDDEDNEQELDQQPESSKPSR